MASFNQQWRNPVIRGIGKFVRVDANCLEILGEQCCVGWSTERADQQADAFGASRDIGLYPLKDIGVLRLVMPEATGEHVDIRTARKLEPKLWLEQCNRTFSRRGRRSRCVSSLHRLWRP